MLSTPRLRAALLATAASLLLAAPASASWTVAPGTVLPNPGITAGVGCVSASACMVVGVQSGASSTSLAATWNGSTFTQATPVSTTAQLADFTCAPTTVCMATGEDDATSTPDPYSETWNGTSFSASPMAVPTSSVFAQSIGVACPTSTSCYAAGWNQDTAFNNAVLLEHWNGTSWSIQTPTLPASTTASKLLDISCTSDTACTAVGYYEATGQPRRPLVEVWNGTSWTPQTAAANVSGQLQGVECDGASRCMAVGIYWDNSTGVQHHLAESRSGTTWTRLSVPDPSASGATDPYLEDVSCITSPSYACHAVGHYLTSGGRGAPTIASWNGTSWSLASSIGTPTGTTDNALYGISCTTTCMAVGASVYSALSGTRPWVELGP
jgi:hypothetical protein